MLELDEDGAGTRVIVIETAPEWSTALGLRAMALAACDARLVFAALADPTRRTLLDLLPRAASAPRPSSRAGSR